MIKLLSYYRWRRWLKKHRVKAEYYPMNEAHIATVARQLAGLDSVLGLVVRIGAVVLIVLVLSVLPIWMLFIKD